MLQPALLVKGLVTSFCKSDRINLDFTDLKIASASFFSMKAWQSLPEGWKKSGYQEKIILKNIHKMG